MSEPSENENPSNELCDNIDRNRLIQKVRFLRLRGARRHWLEPVARHLRLRVPQQVSSVQLPPPLVPAQFFVGLRLAQLVPEQAFVGLRLAQLVLTLGGLVALVERLPNRVEFGFAFGSRPPERMLLLPFYSYKRLVDR